MSTGDGSRGVESIADRAAATLPPSPALARWGLGAMLLAAGVHKLLDPGAWAVYVVDWLAPLLVVSPVAFMLLNGCLEIGFALLLLFGDRFTAVAASVAVASLAATIGYLGVVWASTGQFGDVIARDVGLLGLALAVLADAVKAE